ncbi:MAG TPA: response regulator transcription factor [Aggregatilineales bacterium]|nr:response regulator transcription factor [Anaerolineales bacterium]HRE49195.1 response regulator transcription factor [Aggregatilineales bacterium]
MPNETILVVDDEANIIELTTLYFTQAGYKVISARDGEVALERVKKDRPALVVLDLMLPKIDGWQVCRRIRAESDLPILMLTARDDDVDKIVGLELGADDYLTKPFNPRELVARVKAILRRGVTRRPETAPAVRVGDLTIDPARRTVHVGEREIDLRTKEFDLLLALAENEGIVLSREKLLDLVWGFDFYGQTRTVDVHVAHVRSKIEPAGVGIETVWGVGYKLTQKP